MKRTAIYAFALVSFFAAANPALVRASGDDTTECRFTETRGSTGGGSSGGVRTCRATVVEHMALGGDEAMLRVRCSSGFKLNDENARQFKRNDQEFTIGTKDDRIAVLRIHRETRNGRRMHATLLTSSDPVQGYLSNNARYKGVCREVDSRDPSFNDLGNDLTDLAE
jgi:hypothetical protein